MISINVSGYSFSSGAGEKSIYKFYKTKIENAFSGTNEEMAGRVSTLGKFFTKHIKSKLNDGNPNYTATGRIRQSKRLITMIGATSTNERTESGTSRSYTFKYTFPENFGTEYGYPLGNKQSKLNHVDHVAKWVLDKGIFTYKGAIVGDIKAAKRVAMAMIVSGKGKERKFNVPEWYIIDLKNTDIQQELRKYVKLYHYTWIKKWNNA